MGYNLGGVRMSVDAILEAIEALTAGERTELKARFEEQFPSADSRPQLSHELAAILDERNAAYEANPSDVYTWEQVVAYVKGKK